jgi:outer membrane protein TolC
MQYARRNGLAAGVAAGVLMLPAMLAAQSRPQFPTQSAQVPQPSIAQSPMPGGGQSNVNTLSTSVQVAGPYATSTTAPDARGALLKLTIEEAIQRGVKYNLGAIAAHTQRMSAQSSLDGMRSALLPSVTANLSENVDKVDMAAEGFAASTLPTIGSYFPSVIGPFHFYSAEAQVNYNPFDMVAVRNLRSARQQTKAAETSDRDAREQIVLAVAATYLQALVQQARVESSESQVKYAQVVYDQAAEQKEAGARSAIEVNRSRVQLQTRQQQLFAQQGEMKKQKMRLARLIGLTADRDLQLVEVLGTNDSALPQIESLYERAQERPDVLAVKADLKAAEESRSAAKAEWLPSVHISGNVGMQGATLDSGRLVYQGTGTVSIPLFNGGQTRSDVHQADAIVEARRASLSAKLEDTRFEVRSAWVDEETAGKQLVVATDNRLLAQQTLQQSIDRFKVGAADSVEVAQSEDLVASAEQDYIGSLFALRLSEMSVARAVGAAEQEIPKIVKGVRP